MIKKYRSVLIFAGFLLFNLLESLYFAQGQPTLFNSSPISIGEWACDTISLVGVYWAGILGLYDVMAIERHIVVEVKELK